ncbi:MAG: helix-turn-helix domain-containing protein, partial [Herminiimonas sp.]|nr:helix-turn-helix domain-containing protein [Herminiimonas sp.]
MKSTRNSATAATEPASRQGIQSVEVAGPLLRALAPASAPLVLSALAKNAGMPAAKAHRYLVSLIRVGLVEQDAATGLYDLGRLALELGLASLNRIDAVKLADETMSSLREATSETVALAIWGNMGPTYVRLLQSRRPVTI